MPIGSVVVLEKAREPAGCVLIVDGEHDSADQYAQVLRAAGFLVEISIDGTQAVADLHDESQTYGVILTDIATSGVAGLNLLRAIREHDLDVPVVLMTRAPCLDTAVLALEYGALRYLAKPVTTEVLLETVRRAHRTGEIAKAKRVAVEILGDRKRRLENQACLEASFLNALETLWIAFQPIVSWSRQSLVAYEALVRNEEPTLCSPDALFDAAERLGKRQELGRIIRDATAVASRGIPSDRSLYVNIHTMDLLDDALYESNSLLARHADRTVLEITERASLDAVVDVRSRIAMLRKLGFRIAVDDLGAGYAGLTAFTHLEPDVVKIDMSLIRDVDKHPTKQKLIASLAGLCRDLGTQTISEGVETAGERDVLIGLGCDVFQGFLFARPGRPFPSVGW